MKAELAPGDAALVAELASIEDPAERVLQAHTALCAIEASADAVRDVRDLAVNELRYTRRLTLRQIADFISARTGHHIGKTSIGKITG